MSKDYIIAPNHIRYELEEAERAVVAVNGILEDVIDPTFKGCTCGGLLEAWSEETNGDRGAAALKWMEQNFDAIYATCYASNALLLRAVDILQGLPVPHEKEVPQHELDALISSPRFNYLLSCLSDYRTCCNFVRFSPKKAMEATTLEEANRNWKDAFNNAKIKGDCYRDAIRTLELILKDIEQQCNGGDNNAVNEKKDD